MIYFSLSSSQENLSYGTLQVHVINESTGKPISNALVQIYSEDDFSNKLYEVTTDSSGYSPEINLPAPPIEYSLQPGNKKPYAEYNLRITFPGFQTVEIYGTQILPTIGSTQPVEMALDTGQGKPKIIRIGPNVLYKPEE